MTVAVLQRDDPWWTRAERARAERDCQDLALVELDQPLGDRTLIDNADGQEIAVTQPGVDDKLEWPYDQQRVSEAEYEAALEAMVECVEQRDPAVTAWVRQDLNFKTYAWSKPSDAQGNMSAEALGVCEQEHLKPLR